MLKIICITAILVALTFAGVFTLCRSVPVDHRDLRDDHERLEALVYCAASNIYMKACENGNKLDMLLNIATNNVNPEITR